MHSKYEIFDAARIELKRGINLVEASAGTGKTYAIGMLVLRALVVLRVPIEKILIVTFTKAATEELKSRIRARLVEARDLLDLMADEHQIAGGHVDATLLDWVMTVKDPRTAGNLLRLALYDIDRAGIFTIHGFCQRMLVEQALESGQSFDVELLTDINHIRHQVADDFWRSRIYPLSPLPCSLLTACFKTPEDLLASVSYVFDGNGRIEPAVSPVAEVLGRLAGAMDGAASWWSEHSAGLYESFAAALAEGHFKRGFSENFEVWFQALTRFFTRKTSVVPKNIHLLARGQLVRELNGHKIRGDEKKQAYLADWSLPDREIEQLLTAIDDLILSVRVELAHNLRREVGRRLEEQGAMGFNDLIHRLARALQGDRGRFLQQVLGERFSVALIDEFQDTDNDQWYIFSSIFGGLTGAGHYLYLIGDPKQAIYKFRGADIYSYFQARKSATRLLTLEKNYRSHPSLVEEVNRLFSSRSNPFSFPSDILDYHPVIAAKSPGDVDLLTGDTSLAGMVYCTLQPEPEDKKGRWTSGKAAALFRRFIVAELGRLLAPGYGVLVQSTVQGESERSLAPQDIAILVRSNRQAEEYRQAINEAGIPVVVASRQSVFETRECQEMLLLLQAIAAPGETSRVKTAMTISWFGKSGNSLHELWQDEERFSPYLRRFFQYNQLWQEQGFLAMMSRLLIEEDVLPTLAAGKMAERCISNIQHLLELIQVEENNEGLGIGQILQWLGEMMQEGRSGADVELLLESDEEAVRVVTMHSAKGLEYQVVFCPYLWFASNRLAGEKYQITCHDDGNQAVIDLGSDQFAARRESGAQEELAEDLRLLYVALTRAKVRCYVGWADVKPSGTVGDSFRSALGYLLFPDGYSDYPGQQQKFAELARKKSVHHVVVAFDTEQVCYQNTAAHWTLRPREASGRSLHTDWQMSSFSAMAAMNEDDHKAGVPAHGTEQSDTAQYTVPIPGLPAGPNFGNVIHDLLESLSFSSLTEHGEQDSFVELLSQKCTRYGVVATPEDVQKLLELVVTTPLAPGSFALADLADSACLKEMGFCFQLRCQSTERINTILAEESTFTPLGYKSMRGYLTGFIDLICQYDGKYYILDYKTNFLGEMMADYGAAQLTAAMQAHNYGLQYWIYALVLHRHLQNLLPDYHYERCFGGVRYLFVRGMTPALPGSGVYHTLPDYEKLQQLDRAIGGAENE
jgi:exodeoxyribonuclease V beta subunit